MKKKRQLTEAGHQKIVQANLVRWLRRAHSRHGLRFDYTKAEEIFQTVKQPKVPVSCPDHGEFFVTPDSHVTNASGGCPECASAFKSNQRRKMYKDQYKSWLSSNLPSHLEIIGAFSGPNDPLTVKCNKHGTIKTTMAVYLKNNKTYGCDACASDAQREANSLDLQEVYDELSVRLPNHIHFLGFKRRDAGTRLRMKCDKHGEFETTKGRVKSSVYFCRDCFREVAGYTSNKLQRLVEYGEEGVPSEIGVMIVEVYGVRALKVGVTTRSLTERYKWYLKEVLWSASLSERDAYVLEARIHRVCREWQDLRILYAGMRQGQRWGGDTEVYYAERAQAILATAKQQLSDFFKEEVDYARELGVIVNELPTGEATDVSREKDLTNLPVGVVGVDPETLKVVKEFESIAAASQAGYRNVSLVMNPDSPRTTANGLRWFRKDEFEPYLVKPLAKKQRGRPVRCVECNEHFWNATEAAIIMASRGIKFSASHITSVCKGKRSLAGGYSWEYSNLPEEKIRAHNKANALMVPPNPPKNVSKAIRVFDLKTDSFMGEFASRSEAASVLGLSGAGVITNALKRRDGIAKGFRFETS